MSGTQTSEASGPSKSHPTEAEVLKPKELRYFDNLRDANIARQKEWDAGNQISLTYRATELAGEVGEACSIIKKLERERLGIRGSRDTVEHLAEELADIEICNDLIAMTEGIDLEAAKVAKFNATSEKVGLSVRLRPASDAGWQEDLCKEAAFLLARLDEHEREMLAGTDIDVIINDFSGHVSPSIARLSRLILADAAAPQEGGR